MGLAEKLKSSKPQGSELGRISYTPGGVFDLILASVFINLLALAMPLTLLQVYDRIIPNSAEGTLILLIVGVGSALILEACLRQGRSYVSGWVGARFEHLAGVAAVERLLNVSIVDYERQGSGVHLERFNSLGPLKEFYAGQAILALCDLPFAVLFLSAMYYLAGHLVLVPIALIIVFAIAAMVVGGLLKAAMELPVQGQEQAELQAQAVENLFEQRTRVECGHHQADAHGDVVDHRGAGYRPDRNERDPRQRSPSGVRSGRPPRPGRPAAPDRRGGRPFRAGRAARRAASANASLMRESPASSSASGAAQPSR